MGRTVRENRDGTAVLIDYWRRYHSPRGVMLARKPVEVPLPNLRLLRVARVLVVASAASEETSIRMIRSRERAVRDSIVIDVAITAPRLDPVEVLGREHLTAIERLR